MWNLAGLGCLLLALIYVYHKWCFSYWNRKNVPNLPVSVPFGSFGNLALFKKPIYAHFRDYYGTLKDLGCKHAGFYVLTLPVYLVIDLEYVKNVLVRDSDYFKNHGIYCNEKDDPISAHLFALEDDQWKDLRAKLTPTFTTSKMKMMFWAVKDCTPPMLEAIGNRLEALDVKDLVQKYVMDLISSCGFGIEINSFANPDSEFVEFGRKTTVDYRIGPKFYLLQFWSDLSRKLGLKMISGDVSGFFEDLVGSTVGMREAKGVVRNDFLQILIGLKRDGLLTSQQLSAQVYMFFFAGFDSITLALTYCLYELAIHRDVQQRAREEIHSAMERNEGDCSYESMQEMKYLQQVIDESCRKNSPVAFLFRKCNRDYRVPNTDVTIEKGTMVVVPSYAIHHDPEYYPEPEKFDPERFSEENRSGMSPFSYLPFGHGPRSCIGSRFGMMSIKIAIVEILKNYEIRLNAKTSPTLKLNKYELGYTNYNIILLDATKIN